MPSHPPDKALPSPLVRSELQQLRDDFRALVASAPPVKARLTHRGESADRKLSPVVWMTSFTPEQEQVGQRQHGAGSRLRRDIPDEHGVSLKTIPSALRLIELRGKDDSLDRLMALAVRAGKVLDAVHTQTTNVVAEWSSTAFDVKEKWWTLLFELAWSGRHPLLTAKRQLWIMRSGGHGIIYLPCELDELKKYHAILPAELQKAIPSDWLTAIPDLFVSDIVDMADASAKAMDVLIAELDAAPDEEKPPTLATLRQNALLALGWDGRREGESWEQMRRVFGLEGKKRVRGILGRARTLLLNQATALRTPIMPAVPEAQASPENDLRALIQWCDSIASKSTEEKPQRWAEAMSLKVIAGHIGVRRKTHDAVKARLRLLGSDLQQITRQSYRVRLDGLDDVYRHKFEPSG